jgi:hypothetical protein
MKSLGQSRYALTIGAAAALLAGCGAAQPPIGAPGAMPQSRAMAGGAAHGTSSTRGDLIYATGIPFRHALYIFTYPEGQWVRALKTPGDPFGVCSDKSGNVFAVAGRSIYVYAHGATKPSRTLTDPKGGMFCAVDPVTGNLAVTNTGFSAETGSVAIYADATGSPNIYTDPDIWNPGLCTYDDQGNLFINGYAKGAYTRILLAELPAGSSMFSGIEVNAAFGGPVQWDGQYITVGGPYPHTDTIQRVQISGSSGTVVGKTKLKKPGTKRWYGGFYWIQGSTVIKTGWQSGLWNYPKGGSPIEYLVPERTRLHLNSVTVSVSAPR